MYFSQKTTEKILLFIIGVLLGISIIKFISNKEGNLFRRAKKGLKIRKAKIQARRKVKKANKKQKKKERRAYKKDRMTRKALRNDDEYWLNKAEGDEAKAERLRKAYVKEDRKRNRKDDLKKVAKVAAIVGAGIATGGLGIAGSAGAAALVGGLLNRKPRLKRLADKFQVNESGQMKVYLQENGVEGGGGKHDEIIERYMKKYLTEIANIEGKDANGKKKKISTLKQEINVIRDEMKNEFKNEFPPQEEEEDFGDDEDFGDEEDEDFEDDDFEDDEDFEDDDDEGEDYSLNDNPEYQEFQEFLAWKKRNR